MEFAFYIYTFLLLAMIALLLPISRYGHLKKAKSRYWLIVAPAIVLYAGVVGLRYNVGVDYPAYLTWFKQYKATGTFPVETIEVGYLLLNRLLIDLDFHFSTLFIAIALIQVIFLFKFLEKFTYLSWWYVFFFFTTLFMFSSMNIMRQTMSYFIFCCAIATFLDRKYVITVALFLLGYSFHKSILFFVWVFPLLRWDWFKSRPIQAGLLVFVTVTSSLFDYLLNLIIPFATILGYSYYIDNIGYMKELTEAGETGSGLGKYLFLFVDLAIVLYSPKLKRRFEEANFTSYYNLYFLGAILARVLAGNFILYRANDFLANFRVLVLSFLCYYLFNTKSKYSINIYVGVLIIIGMLAYFYRGIGNSAAKCAPFEFVF